MRTLLIVCCGLLLLALANLPIGYYTFLRIVVSVASLLIVLLEYQKGFNFWVIIFGLILLLFNPIIPVYLHDKDAWIPIDIIACIVFSLKALLLNPLERAKS